MKKFSKLIALFSALCMIATLFSGISVFAEDAPAEETPAALTYYWDADHDFVTVEFEEEITEASLAGIKLLLNGVEVPATVGLHNHASAEDPNFGGNAVRRYTYLVIPTGDAKIAFDTIYELKLTGVTGAVSGKSVTDEVFFKVTKISDNMKLGTAHGDWVLGRQGGANTYENVDGAIVTNHIDTSTLNLANSLGFQKPKDEPSLNDYTVKMTYRVSDPATKYVINLCALVYTPIGYTGYDTPRGSTFLALSFGNEPSGSKPEATKYVYLWEQFYGSVGGAAANKYQQKHWGTPTNQYSAKWGDVLMSEDINLKMSIKDGFARGYVNNMKFGDMVLFDGEKAHNGGIFSETRSMTAGKTITATGFLVTKAEEVEVTTETIAPRWDADSDFISLTFDKEMPLEDLRDLIVLKENGVPVNATVSLINHPDVARINNSYRMAYEYTYAIVPEGGMVLDAIYTLSLDGMINLENGAKRYAFDFTKSFKVVKLDSGMKYANKTDLAWNYFNGNNSNIGATNYDSEADVLNLTMSTVNTGWKGGRFARHYPTTAAADPSQKDYTVKMTIATTSNVAKSTYRLYTHFIDHTSNLLIEYGVDSDAKHIVKLIENDGTTLAGGQGMNVAFFDEHVLGGTVTLKLSAKDGFVNAYINNEKVADAPYTQDHYGKAAYAVGVSLADTTAPVISMSNYVMTKAIEVTDFEIGNISITDENGEALEAVTGNVNVNVPVLNGSNAEKNILVVCAFYNGTKLTNCVVSPLNTRVVSSGDFVNIPLENMSPNGGTKLKVFVWDNATNLVPYMNNLELPTPVTGE